MRNKISSKSVSILVGIISILVLPLMTSSSAQMKQQGLSWQRILKALFSPSRPQHPISRPIQQVSLCFIAPNNQTIYSTRPLLLWKGNLKKVAVTNLGRDDYFWSDDKINGQKNFVVYGGQELKPGQSYEWHGFIGENPAILASFQVMDAQRRSFIDNELKALETQLKANRVSKETIALERANYFVKKELWSDVLQEAYSVPNPSSELLQILQKLPDDLCKGAS